MVEGTAVIGWILLGAFAALASMGALMNWLWALLSAGGALCGLFLLGVHSVLGWWGVSLVGVSAVLIGSAVLYREARDLRNSKKFKLTED